jgi:hypothetical protein
VSDPAAHARVGEGRVGDWPLDFWGSPIRPYFMYESAFDTGAYDSGTALKAFKLDKLQGCGFREAAEMANELKDVFEMIVTVG